MRSAENSSRFVILHKDAAPTSFDDWQPIMAIDNLKANTDECKTGER